METRLAATTSRMTVNRMAWRFMAASTSSTSAARLGEVRRYQMPKAISAIATA